MPTPPLSLSLTRYMVLHCYTTNKKGIHIFNSFQILTCTPFESVWQQPIIPLNWYNLAHAVLYPEWRWLKELRLSLSHPLIFPTVRRFSLNMVLWARDRRHARVHVLRSTMAFRCIIPSRPPALASAAATFVSLYDAAIWRGYCVCVCVRCACSLLRRWHFNVDYTVL